MTEEERIFARTTEQDFERFWEVMAELRGTRERETIIDCLHLMTEGYDPDLKSWEDLELVPPEPLTEAWNLLHERIGELEIERSCRTCHHQYFEEPDPCANCLDADNDDEATHNWKWDGVKREKCHVKLSEHDRETVERTKLAIIKEALHLSEEKKEAGEG